MTTPENSTQVTLPPLPVNKKDSALAITSLVSGLVGWTFLPIIGAIVAIITGHLAKKEIRDSAGTISGDGMALAGLIMGYVQIGLVLLGIICFITFFAAMMPVMNNNFDMFSSLLPALM
jgi:hypothetical protein